MKLQSKQTDDPLKKVLLCILLPVLVLVITFWLISASCAQSDEQKHQTVNGVMTELTSGSFDLLHQGRPQGEVITVEEYKKLGYIHYSLPLPTPYGGQYTIPKVGEFPLYKGKPQEYWYNSDNK